MLLCLLPTQYYAYFMLTRHNIPKTPFTDSLLGIVTPPPAALVRPGTTYTYTWVIPKGAGPKSDDADCINHLYYSAVDPVKDTNSGLVGPLLVCKKKALKSGKQVIMYIYTVIA